MNSKLPINLECLLRQRQVEGERIEYKAGWGQAKQAQRFSRAQKQFRHSLKMEYAGELVGGESQSPHHFRQRLQISPRFGWPLMQHGGLSPRDCRSDLNLPGSS
jgi:hypothetical protein